MLNFEKRPIPNSKVTLAKINGTTYVYFTLKAYRNSSGKPTSSRKIIGKAVDNNTMMIPNHNYFDIYKINKPEKEPTISDVTRIGHYLLFDKIITDLDIKYMLKNIFVENYNDILTIILYMLANNKAMMHLEDYQEEFKVYSKKALSSPRISEIFNSINLNSRNSFFKKWIKKTKKDEYIVYDITSVSSYCSNNEYVEYGYNRDQENLPQINLGVYFGETTKLPICYTTYAGSINDKTYLQYMLQGAQELGINTSKLVLDTGFYSKANLKYMASNDVTFIVCMTEIKKIQSLIRKNQIYDFRNYINEHKVYGAAFDTDIYVGKPAKIHIFFDGDKKLIQEQNLYRLINKYEEELTKLKTLSDIAVKKYGKFFTICLNEDETFTFEKDIEKINEVRNTLGYFQLITNDVNLTSSDIIGIYRKKDLIEKHYDNLKHYIDGMRSRTHSTETFEGKTFLNFQSLICKSYIENKLEKYFENKSVCIDKIISELGKIKMLKVNNKKRLVQPLTKTQKEILSYFDISEKDVLTKISSL